MVLLLMLIFWFTIVGADGPSDFLADHFNRFGNWLTATNVLLFTLYHWSCSTTLLTIYKETKSKKWTFVSFIVPTIIGVGVTMLTTLIANLLGLV